MGHSGARYDEMIDIDLIIQSMTTLNNTNSNQFLKVSSRLWPTIALYDLLLKCGSLFMGRARHPGSEP